MGREVEECGGREEGGQREMMETVLKDLSMQSETDWWTSSGLVTFYRQHVVLALTNDWSAEAYEVIEQYTRTHTNTNTNKHRLSLVPFDNAETADGLLLIAACVAMVLSLVFKWHSNESSSPAVKSSNFRSLFII